LKSQPDLNFHNEEVQDALLDVTRFWLDRGVDGFRLDTVNFYFHDADLRDNPPWTKNEDFAGIDRRVNPYGAQDHLYDKTRPENLDFLARFRQLLDAYPGTTAVGEIGADRDEEGTMAAYTEAGLRIHMAYNFRLLGRQSQAEDIAGIVTGIDKAIGSGWPCWSLSNHDVRRVPTRWAPQADPSAFQPVASAMLLSLRGTICLYQGEELGLPEADVPFEALQDPQGKTFWPEDKGRDGCRTPMPWTDSEPHAGFSSVDGWLPMPTDHARRAVSAQENDESAPLNRLRAFLAWRAEQPALVRGELARLEAVGAKREVVLITRKTNDHALTGVFNLTGNEAELARPDGEALDVPGYAGTNSEAGGTLTLPAFSCAFFRH
ncbi:MAG: alpha-amylase family glycosyl hydrolase, partial [Pseudomonadota bacterium]